MSNIKISKVAPDTRFNTCGFFIPDGFYRVVELTAGRIEKVKKLQAFGYKTAKVEKSEGLYEEGTNRLVDEDSVRAVSDPGNPEATEYTYLSDAAEDEPEGDASAAIEGKQAEVDVLGVPIEEMSLDELRQHCRAHGIAFNPKANTRMLQNLIKRGGGDKPMQEAAALEG